MYITTSPWASCDVGEKSGVNHADLHYHESGVVVRRLPLYPPDGGAELLGDCIQGVSGACRHRVGIDCIRCCRRSEHTRGPLREFTASENIAIHRRIR